MSERYDRANYVNQSAMNRYKTKQFNGKKTTKDEYVPERILHEGSQKNYNQAVENKYGKNRYNYHISETDHVVSAKEAHEKYRGTFCGNLINDDQLKDVINSDSNFALTSQHTNRAKKQKPNEQFVKNNDDPLISKNKNAIIDKTKSADRKIERGINQKARENLRKDFVETGKEAAEEAGTTAVTMSGLTNIAAVFNGEKTAQEALADIAKDTGTATGKAFISGGAKKSMQDVFEALKGCKGKTVATLGKTGSMLIENSQIIGATISVAGDTMLKYLSGEINTDECVFAIGENGLNVAVIAQSRAIGKTVGETLGRVLGNFIPMPVVGAAVGALIGSVLLSKVSNSLVEYLEKMDFEHRERLRIQDECARFQKQAEKYKQKLSNYLECELSEYRSCFDSAFCMLENSIRNQNPIDTIRAANQITKKFNGEPVYEDLAVFKKDYILNNGTDLL